MKKRIMSFALAVCMLCALLVPAASASDYRRLLEPMDAKPGDTVAVGKFTLAGDPANKKFVSPENANVGDVIEIGRFYIEKSPEELALLGEEASVLSEIAICPFHPDEPAERKLLSSTTIAIGGTDNNCRTIRFTYEYRCSVCNYRIVTTIDDVVTPAHSWGPLNPDGYTHTCIHCGYTDRA